MNDAQFTQEGYARYIKDAFEKVIELAWEQARTIEFEVSEPVQGTMYNTDDVKDAKEALLAVEKAVANFIDGDILERIVKEAIEHWPDAENWPIIKEAQNAL